MIGPPLPYNVHTNVHAVFHGIPAPPLDLLRFPGFPSSKDFEKFRSRDSSWQNSSFHALSSSLTLHAFVPLSIVIVIVIVIATKREKLETYIFFSFFCSFPFSTNAAFEIPWYESTGCYEPSLHRGFKEVFAALSSDPWFKARTLRRREQPCHG